MDSIKIELEGFEELKQKLGNPKLFREPIKELLTAAATLGEVTAITAISGGTTIAEQSIRRKVWSRAMKAWVYTRIAEPRAMSIEKGRSPGEDVSFRALASWLKGSPFRLSLTRDEAKQVYEIQEAIRQRGAKGKGYMAAARAVVEKELPKLKEAALQQLERLFYR